MDDDVTTGFDQRCEGAGELLSRGDIELADRKDVDVGPIEVHHCLEGRTFGGEHIAVGVWDPVDEAVEAEAA